MEQLQTCPPQIGPIMPQWENPFGWMGEVHQSFAKTVGSKSVGEDDDDPIVPPNVGWASPTIGVATQPHAAYLLMPHQLIARSHHPSHLPSRRVAPGHGGSYILHLHR